MTSRDSIPDTILEVKKPHHDTLYCSESYKQTLINSMMSGHGLRADAVTIGGLNVVTHPDIPGPIVCERGQLFPVAGDYHSGEVEPKDL